MNSEQHCPRCGQVRPPDAPAGHCPKCLVQLAIEAADVETTVAMAAGGSPHPIPLPLGGGEGESQKPLPAVSVRVKYFGDYEMVEEIARGGMGVVWKARQASLNRPVALKMILAGKFASEADVRRFHTEAEAAANLQHPNIVAIHEVGQHEGQHYFSMDYVAGKNLAELVDGSPMPAAQAAALVKRIAEAVHYAHQRGTLHRDLKPSNVLIDAEGQPRITDFGLAKRFGALPSGGSDGRIPAKAGTTSELTHTGAVLGTPAYMPPEQAAGKNELVGPASDVYSLGAILYHLLVGRAPFVAETPVATLRKVMEEEPLAPTKLNPKTPPDLATICLKCLEKQSERRYHSARELAEELGRFLNHEPILATPASAWRKTWSWLLKHPWLLMGAATFVGLGLVGLAYGLWERVQYVEWNAAHPGRPFTGRNVLDDLPEPPYLFMLGAAMLVFKWCLDLRGQRKNLPTTRLQVTLGLISGLWLLTVGLAGAAFNIREYVWKHDITYLFFLIMFAWLPCLIGALTLLQTFRSQHTTHFGGAGEEEGEFLPVFQAPVILNPGVTTLGWGVMMVVFGLLAYSAMPPWRHFELSGFWGAGPVSVAMLSWLRVYYFTNALGIAVLVHLFRTLQVRKAPAWIMIVGWLFLAGDALLVLVVAPLPGTAAPESFLAGLIGALAMARICKLRRAEPADVAAAKALVNEEASQLAAQFGSRRFRVSLLGVAAALMLVAFAFSRDQWGVFLVISALSALQPPLFVAWWGAHKTRLALVFTIILAYQIPLTLTGLDFPMVGDSPTMHLIHFLPALVAGYAAGYLLVKSSRIRRAC